MNTDGSRPGPLGLGGTRWPFLARFLEGVLGHRTAALLLLAAFLYVPLTFLGYGTDPDSYRVVRTSERLLRSGVYRPSRPPGYFLHEIVSTALVALGGSVAANLGTVVLSLVCIYAFLEICRHHRIPRAHLLALLMISQPRYWASSTATIDYLWALAPAMLGYLASLKDRNLLAGSLLGLAIGTRLSSGAFMLAVLGSWLASGRLSARRGLVLVGTASLVAIVLYLPQFVSSGCSLGFLTYVRPGWGLTNRLGAFAYRNVYFWGLQTVVALLVLSPLIARRAVRSFAGEHREAMVFALVLIAAEEGLLLMAPLEEEYLLPILPAALMIVGLSLRGERRPLLILLAASLSFNVVSLNLVRGQLDKHQIAATLGLWVEPGHLVREVTRRVEIQRWLASGHSLRQVIDRLEHVRAR